MHDDPEKYPNVTSTLHVGFIIGLTLHVVLFLLNVFYEPHFHYYKWENQEPAQSDMYENVDPQREQE